MKGNTHAAIGANSAWLAVLFGVINPWSIGLLLVGAIVALLPDLDASHAKIRHIGGGIGNVIPKFSKHRGALHSLLVAILISIFVLIFLFVWDFSFFVIPLAVLVAYVSHLLLDALNKSGIQLLYPWKKKIRLLPKDYTCKLGGLVDQLLLVAGLFGVGLFLAVYFLTFI